MQAFSSAIVDSGAPHGFTEGARNLESRTLSVPTRATINWPSQQTDNGAECAPRHSHPKILPTLMSLLEAVSSMPARALFFIPPPEEVSCR